MRAARPVRGAAWGNGPGEIPAPRPRPTQPGHRDRDVFLGGEHRFESGALAVGEQREPGVQGAPDPVERVSGAAAVMIEALSVSNVFVAGREPAVRAEPFDRSLRRAGTAREALERSGARVSLAATASAACAAALAFHPELIVSGVGFAAKEWHTLVRLLSAAPPAISGADSLVPPNFAIGDGLPLSSVHSE